MFDRATITLGPHSSFQNSFAVRFGSPLLFLIVMEAISREFRVALSWELLYADLAVIAEIEED